MEEIMKTKSKTMWESCLLVPILLLLASHSFAATLYVGSCHASSYPTISAAVAAATPGSLIAVCPGTYPEQVFISQPLTLQGITSGGGDRARIIVPANVIGGGTNWTFVPDPDFINKVAPQIFVNSPSGPVKISNLTIDGSAEVGAPSACPNFSSSDWTTTAIFFENTSGTINEVYTVGQGKNNGCGTGIRAYAAPPITPTVTISNNSIQDANFRGLHLEAPSAGASMSVSVTKNTLLVGAQNYGSFAVAYTGISGTISSNFIQAQGHGVVDEGVSGSLTVSGNTIISANGTISFGGIITSGSVLPGPETFTGNRVVNYYVGMEVPGVTSTVASNTIVNSYLAFELGCNASATLSGNAVNNAQIGMDTVPTGFSPAGKIACYSVDQIKGTSSCP
jgi:hypothetical protein